MPQSEFRKKLLVHLSEIENHFLNKANPDYVILKKLHEIKSYCLDEPQESSKVQEPETQDGDPQPKLYWCVEIPDKLGGLTSHMFDTKDNAENFANDANLDKGWSDHSPFAYRVVMKYVEPVTN